MQPDTEVVNLELRNGWNKAGDPYWFDFDLFESQRRQVAKAKPGSLSVLASARFKWIEFPRAEDENLELWDDWNKAGNPHC